MKQSFVIKLIGRSKPRFSVFYIKYRKQISVTLNERLTYYGLIYKYHPQTLKPHDPCNAISTRFLTTGSSGNLLSFATRFTPSTVITAMSQLIAISNLLYAICYLPSAVCHR